MEKPNLPFWFYMGQVSITIDGPVYVVKGDALVGSDGPSVIVPRTRFYATARAVSHLVRLGQIRRLPDPKAETPKPKSKGRFGVRPTPAAAEAPEVVAEAPIKSASTEEQSGTQGGSSEPASNDAVIASDAGEGEAGSSSAPEEQESSGRGSKRSRRS